MIKVSRGCLGEEELAEVKEAFAYGYFGLAAKVTEFEAALSRILQAEHVVATNNGTCALHLALDALGVGPGSEVILPSLTFVACFQAVSLTGATPVACDVHDDNLLMDVADVERRLTPRTRVLMPVHYASNPCDMDAIHALARRHKLRVVEDAAHALGSTYKGKPIGSSGDIACFSFDSIKNITCGEGGAVVCQDADLANRMRQKRLLGMDRKGQTSTAWKERGWQFDVRAQGFRYHMSNINAAIGLAQLRKLDAFIARRRAICKRYHHALSGVPGIRLLNVNYDEVAPHIFVIRVLSNQRDELMHYLKERDIETGINYIPNHLHTFYRKEGLSLPVTELAYQEILTLPLHCELSDTDVGLVIDQVLSFLKAAAGSSR